MKKLKTLEKFEKSSISKPIKIKKDYKSTVKVTDFFKAKDFVPVLPSKFVKINESEREKYVK